MKKAELITFLQNNLQPSPAPRTRPPRPTRPPPPPPTPQALPLVRFRPDRPRQPELLSHSQPPDSRPYQLNPKRSKETFIESPMKQEPPPNSNLKQIKRMKKKLGKLNKKIRHSKKKHNNLISKRNLIKKKIKELKGPHESHEPKGPH